jgi:hypothetical protein
MFLRQVFHDKTQARRPPDIVIASEPLVDWVQLALDVWGFEFRFGGILQENEFRRATVSQQGFHERDHDLGTSRILST